MVVNQEALEARLATLKRDREQLMANFHAISGAIQDIEFWLAHLASDEVKDESVAVPQ